MSPDLAPVRERLIRQLERAAELGLVRLQDADEDPEVSPDPVSRETNEAMQADAPQAAEPAVEELAADELVASPTRASEDAKPLPAAVTSVTLALPEQAPRCYAPEAFTLPEVAGLDPAEAIADLRSRLIGEFDYSQTETALALARLYIAYALVPEALTVLADFAPEHPEAPVLAAMAMALDGRAAPPGHALSAPACQGVQALWRALGQLAEDKPALALLSEAAAGRALQVAPVALARPLAEGLGLAAAALGDWPAAARFQARADRASLAGAPPSAAKLLLDARLARQDGDTTTALAKLRALWAYPPTEDLKAEGLLMLAEMVLDGALADAGETHQLRTDLAALASAHHGTSLGERAFLAEVRLSAQALGRDVGLDLLAHGHAVGLIGEAGYGKAVRLLSGLDDDTSEPLALAYERTPERYASAMGQAGFRQALALSYADIGLPERAEATLAPTDPIEPLLARALADAYVEAGQPSDARRLAALLPEPEARAALQARALEAEGKASAALAALDPESAADKRARLAWAAGDWAEAAAALSERYTETPTLDIAARLAAARTRAGMKAPAPDEADNTAASAPALAGAPALPEDASAEDVRSYLEGLRSEAQAIRELLDDG
ncbi:MAG: hypothetical protein AAGI34_01670 [Pseudomonadota bacterium]